MPPKSTVPDSRIAKYHALTLPERIAYLERYLKTLPYDSIHTAKIRAQIADIQRKIDTIQK